ncbi:hypothetical protein [Guyparkeria sp.]|uniref:hypothetical protein n=1 Tax=Guyparkeria sp. TaxID=2035736 RepID=UPI00397DE771
MGAGRVMVAPTFMPGPSIGLVAGWSFPARVFVPLARHLSGREVLALDWSRFATDWLQPGTGDLHPPTRSPAVWVGWSLGGSLLLEAVRRGVIRPSRLVLLQTTPCFLARDERDTPIGWPGVAYADWQGLRRAAERSPWRAAMAFRRRFGLPLDPEPTPASTSVAGLDWLARLDLREALADIDVPVDLWLAPDDPLVPVDWPGRIDLPDRVRVCRFERGGHAAWIEHAVPLAADIASRAGR